MKSDCYAPPSHLYIPPPVPRNMTKFTAHCIGWGLLALAGGLAICAVVIMAESILAP